MASAKDYEIFKRHVLSLNFAPVKANIEPPPSIEGASKIAETVARSDTPMNISTPKVALVGGPSPISEGNQTNGTNKSSVLREEPPPPPPPPSSTIQPPAMNQGPLLKGSKHQLEEARRFLDNNTKPKSRGRPTYSADNQTPKKQTPPQELPRTRPTERSPSKSGLNPSAAAFPTRYTGDLLGLGTNGIAPVPQDPHSVTLTVKVPEIIKAATADDRPSIPLARLQQLADSLPKSTTDVAACTPDQTSQASNAMPAYAAKIIKDFQTRLDTLEADNARLTKEVLALIDAEERRKYLGTSSAKLPFAVDVYYYPPKDGSSIRQTRRVVSIQVNATLTVADLIRRVRTQADLTPAQTLAPRLLVGDKEVGHIMLLGEAGISASSFLNFAYDS